MKPAWIFILILGAIFLISSGLVSKTSNSEGVVVIKPQGFLKGEARLLFVGDIFLDRYIREVGEAKGEDYIFKCVDSLLKSADIVVGNLEGPITDYVSKSVGTVPGSADNFVFTFPTTSASVLYRHNIRIVNLGNNHIGNFGEEGIRQTKEFLNKANMNYFGGLEGQEPILRTEISGQKITFISYNQFGGHGADVVVEEISSEKKENPDSRIIVYAHWGDEYVEPTEDMRLSAKKFAQAGASAIIGSHPHVIQASDRIGDTAVFYSLGNFIFDQYWDEQVNTGLAVELIFSKSGISAKRYALDIQRNGQTCLK